MRKRVRHILLVSSLYDSFLLTEDGYLNEALLQQFRNLNLTQNPDLIRVSTGAEALDLVRHDPHVDLVVSSLQLGDMDAVDMAEAARDAGHDVPVVVIAFDNRELTDFMAGRDTSVLDRIFLWQGDVRILLAIVKDREDRLNVAHDTGVMGVPAIIVVEDNIRFYSSFLPVIYTEIMRHSSRLIVTGLNLSQKLLRARARPKLLLCCTYEEAWEYFRTYEDYILGIISDIEFPWKGDLHRRAGVELISRIREARSDVPVVLQSSQPENRDLARRAGARFLLKGSPVMLHQLRKILTGDFGFGDFVFRLPDGEPIDRATDLKELVRKLETVPVESIGHHGERNHFSLWLRARTEFDLAEKLRPRRISDYPTLEDLREDLIRSISEYRRARDRVIVADYDRESGDFDVSIARVGGGSLGGKARGLAFMNRLLTEYAVQERFPGVRVFVPPCIVLGTDIFDQFLEENELGGFAIGSTSDAETERWFLASPFPEEVLRDLEAFLRETHRPLAVRSSGLLEDSPSQPLAGIYQTFMLPNNDVFLGARLAQVVAAVKRVYASTFSKQAKAFLEMTPYRLEEEKMAVIIQEIVGATHGSRFYPDFAGVARSYNYYPTAPATAEDGIAAAALGFGHTVVDGGACVRFCPRYPRHQVSFSSVEEAVRSSQREFYALDLARMPGQQGAEGSELTSYGLDTAETDGTLAAIGSTYSPDNDTISPGTGRAGVRLVNFAPVLEHGVFPLAELLDTLLEIGSKGTSLPVEVEFAVNLSASDGGSPEFGFLQMRPLALSREAEELEIGEVPAARILCRSASVMGNGLINDLRDIVVVDRQRFQRGRSQEAAQQIARFNAQLHKEGTPYLLVGVGRWGSADPHLGIPVAWNQIAGARVIIEAGFRDVRVAPSQGTHFFQNLNSCQVGYFTVNPEAGEGHIDWDWLAARPARDEADSVRHIRLDAPLLVKMDGRRGEGVILKP